MDEGNPSDNFLEDPKFLGCFVDVRHILEPLCAGKNQCDVNVAKIKMETPCHKWCKLYLEVSYKCIHGKITSTLYKTNYFQRFDVYII